MSNTSTSNLPNQVEEVHQETSLGIMQSPPLINGDQTAEIGGVMLKPKINEKGNDEKSMCIIDVNNEKGGVIINNNNHDDDDDDHHHHDQIDDDDDERVCRICQLRSYDHLPAGTGNTNLVLLGCACRGELSLSHYHCAFVWFLRKGNRTCEICGEPAKNIIGIEDTGFRAYSTDIDTLSSAEFAMSFGPNETTDHHQRGKCLSRIILATLVLAFLLPWVVRPNKLF